MSLEDACWFMLDYGYRMFKYQLQFPNQHPVLKSLGNIKVLLKDPLGWNAIVRTENMDIIILMISHYHKSNIILKEYPTCLPVGVANIILENI